MFPDARAKPQNNSHSDKVGFSRLDSKKWKNSVEGSMTLNRNSTDNTWLFEYFHQQN
jgi:hypothetical protein